jgi:hypothetical protein
MSVRVHDVGVLEGFVPAVAPRDGVVLGRDGRWLALGPDGLRFARVPAQAPIWARHGRILYAAVGPTLAALDALGGELLWTRELTSDATAIAAGAVEGRRAVCIATRGRLAWFDPRGNALGVSALPEAIRQVTHLAWSEGARWIGCEDGLWRIDGPNVRRITHGTCRALHAAHGAVRAVLDTPQGARLVEDDGAPMVWPFFGADEEGAGWPRPCGADGWWLCAPGSVPRVVDRQRRVRWEAGFVARLSGASEGCVTCVTQDAVVLTGPGLPPLRLPVEDPGAVADVLAGDGVHLVVSPGATRCFVVEGS